MAKKRGMTIQEMKDRDSNNYLMFAKNGVLVDRILQSSDESMDTLTQEFERIHGVRVWTEIADDRYFRSVNHG